MSCHQYDTISIGKLPPGLYELRRSLEDVRNNPRRMSVDTIFFTVQQSPTHHADDIIVYPNPTSGTVTVELKFCAGEYSNLTVFSIHGQRVLRMGITKDKAIIDFGSLASGVYLISATGNNQEPLTQKIIKIGP